MNTKRYSKNIFSKILAFSLLFCLGLFHLEAQAQGTTAEEGQPVAPLIVGAELNGCQSGCVTRVHCTYNPAAPNPVFCPYDTSGQTTKMVLQCIKHCAQ